MEPFEQPGEEGFASLVAASFKRVREFLSAISSQIADFMRNQPN